MIWNFNNDYLISTGILTSVVIVTLRSPVAATINLFPSLVFQLLFFDISILTYVMYGIVFAGMIAYVLIDFSIPKTDFSKIGLGTTLIVSSFVVYFVFLGRNEFGGRKLYEQTLLLGVASVLIIAIVSYFMSVSKSANILFDSVTFAYLTYYRPAVALIAIQDIIQKQNTRQGIYGVFRHSLVTGAISDEGAKDIIRQFLADFEKRVPKDAIIFFVEKDVHGIFLPITKNGNLKSSLEGNRLTSRFADDMLKGIEKLFFRSQKEYVTSLGETANVKIRSGVSIYGLQDSSLSKLEENSLFALNSFNSKSENIVSLFDPSKLKEVLLDSKKLSNLDFALKLDNFENAFRGIYSLNENK